MSINTTVLNDLFFKGLIGNKVHYFKEVDSTNSYATRFAKEGAAEGEVVIADKQTRGRGRLNRVWQSPEGKNVYTSIILRPPIKPSTASQLTLTAGVAVADIISEYCLKRAVLKWPNDVLIGKKKICGILTEMRTKAAEVDFVIVGIGVNVNMTEEDFHPSVRDIATSLKMETTFDVSRTEFTVNLYRALERWYKVVLTEGFESIRREWIHYSGMMGRQIVVDNSGELQRGEVVGLGECGELIFIDREKKIRHVLTGDVSLIAEE